MTAPVAVAPHLPPAIGLGRQIIVSEWDEHRARR